MFKPSANLNYNLREVGTEAKNDALPASILLQLWRKDRPGRMAAVDEPAILRALRYGAPGDRPAAESHRRDRITAERRCLCKLRAATSGIGKYI
jgi:hypothetical protein